MTYPTGERVDVDSPESIQSAVSRLVDDCAPGDLADPLVVPEVSYPFHPSTGLVANPDVVEALVSALQSSAEGDVDVAYAGSRYADGTQSASFLGYDAVTDDPAVDVVDLESTDAVERTVALDAGPRTVRIPTPLIERPVVVVPTLRYDSAHPIAGGMVTAARPARISTSVASSVAAAALAVDPAGVLLDATYTYTGQPHETGVLVGGSDVVAVDRVAAELADVDPSAVPALAAVPNADAVPPRLRSLSIDSLRDALPNQSAPESDAPGSLVRRGYRMYTQLTGDAYPPQFDA